MDVSKQNEPSVDTTLSDQEVATSNRAVMDEKPNVSTEQNKKTSKQQSKYPCRLADEDSSKGWRILRDLEKAGDLIIILIIAPQLIARFEKIYADSSKNRKFPPYKMDVSKQYELCVEVESSKKETMDAKHEKTNIGTEENNKTSEQKFKIKNFFPQLPDQDVNELLETMDNLKKGCDIIERIIIDGTSINSDR